VTLSNAYSQAEGDTSLTVGPSRTWHHHCWQNVLCKKTGVLYGAIAAAWHPPTRVDWSHCSGNRWATRRQPETVSVLHFMSLQTFHVSVNIHFTLSVTKLIYSDSTISLW